MHQTHLLLQISKNFVSGQNQPDARATNNYLTQILARERPDGTTIPISNFGRIEFQDGKRKQATQSYHGSGRPHLHRLEFVTKKRTQEDLQTFQLHNTIAASTTNLSQQMTKYVLAPQIDWSCATPLPVIEEESRFDPDTNTYHIQHTIKDKKKWNARLLHTHHGGNQVPPRRAARRSWRRTLRCLHRQICTQIL